MFFTDMRMFFTDMRMHLADNAVFRPFGPENPWYALRK